MVAVSSTYCGVLPFEGRASQLRLKFNESLKSSLLHLFDVCQDVVPDQLNLLVKERVQSLNPHNKFSGFVSLIHTLLYNAIEAEDEDGVAQVLSHVDTYVKEATNEVQFVEFTKISEFLAPKVLYLSKYTLPQERQDAINIAPLSPEDLNAMKSAFRHGYNLLEQISPPLHEEAMATVSEILLYNSPGLLGGSSFDFFGMFYCSLPHHWNITTGLLDFITHEQGHLYLHLLTNLDPLVLNGQEMQISPIRKAPRPLMGVYHATYVSARIYYVLFNARRMGLIPQEEHDHCDKQIKYFAECYEQGCETLNQFAKLTPMGRDVLDNSKELFN